jgi:K+-transporting ATPase A subunit
MQVLITANSAHKFNKYQYFQNFSQARTIFYLPIVWLHLMIVSRRIAFKD